MVNTGQQFQPEPAETTPDRPADDKAPRTYYAVGRPPPGQSYRFADLEADPKPDAVR